MQIFVWRGWLVARNKQLRSLNLQVIEILQHKMCRSAAKEESIDFVCQGTLDSYKIIYLIKCF